MSQSTIVFIISLLQLCIAFGLINVWFVRFNLATKYRGGNAQTMQEEFSVYGLPQWSLYLVGGLKIAIALIMLIAVFVSSAMYPFGMMALGLLCVLMIGAIYMHLKVHDAPLRILPAISMFSMSIVTIVLSMLL